MSQNLVTPETMATVLSFQHGVPIIDLKQFDIQAQAVSLIPENVARESNVLALAVDGDVLADAMVYQQEMQEMRTDFYIV